MSHYFADLLKHDNMRSRVIKITMKAMYMYGLKKGDIASAINVNADKGDDAVIDALLKLKQKSSKVSVKPSTDKPDTTWANKRAMNRAKEINNLFQGPLAKLRCNTGNMLDIGAGDGVITMAVGLHSFNLAPEDLYGIDIQQWGVNTHEDKLDSNINFKLIEEAKVEIPFDVQFNRVIILQTLHHVKDLGTMMFEINRVCAPGAIVIIREHDCQSMNMKKLIDIEHVMYDVVMDGFPIKEFRETYYGEYKSKYQWTAIFEAHMFQRLNTKQVVRPGATNFYYAMYQKIGNAKPMKDYSIDTLRSIYKKLFHKSASEKMKKPELVNYIMENIATSI